jgi:mRNA-degrading endonuclease RelE of RelBE toxin-antitoxin system
MDTAAIRIPEDKKNILKAISTIENKKLNEVVVELIDEYIERHYETLELLSIPGLYETLTRASKEFKEGKGINKKKASHILEALEELEKTENPLIHKDVRPLIGKLRGFYRLRVGEYRIIFELDRKNKRIGIDLIVSRGNAC